MFFLISLALYVAKYFRRLFTSIVVQLARSAMTKQF